MQIRVVKAARIFYLHAVFILSKVTDRADSLF